ncbi:GNAT family N-acetyltransferase [Magnetospira sp. QH-2]|uniref:GNAT family N-acetyltransferase n=1 Tax=Magnetospira sp. (strain QH-2) TaxID=1288970 RepID=UPI0003E81BD5|nr:GNAT family N-acetyltransferase [Magnetospira sp. QH-2]CCQ74882.1 protein of unknown function[Include Acetyltransferase (GNAT) family domain] [Magnetospira sp. QH-2]
MDANKEWANTRLKLAHHRVMARALKARPGYLDEARNVLHAWTKCSFRPAFVDTWKRLLDSPLHCIRREIVLDNPHADWLRGSSPFSLIPSQPLNCNQVRRLWRIAASRAIRILEPEEYPLFAAHLKNLDSADRVRRFWNDRSDYWIDSYTASLGEKDAVIGHFNEAVALDGAAHVGLIDKDAERMVEIGISVLESARHHGIAHHLMERAILWARNHQATSLHAVCMTSNRSMIHLARDHDMEIFREEDSLEGLLHMPPGNAETRSLEILENQFGDWDYWNKAHKTAYALAVGPPPVLTDGEQASRLDQLAAQGRTDLLASYVIIMRYMLTHAGLTDAAHMQSLAKLRERLEPKVAHDSHLLSFVRALPGTTLH